MKQMGIEDVEKKYIIIFVNALRAQKGRQKENKILLEKSNMEELRTVIIQELKKTNRFAILANTVHEIETLLEINRFKNTKRQLAPVMPDISMNYWAKFVSHGRKYGIIWVLILTV